MTAVSAPNFALTVKQAIDDIIDPFRTGGAAVLTSQDGSTQTQSLYKCELSYQASKLDPVAMPKITFVGDRIVESKRHKCGVNGASPVMTEMLYLKMEKSVYVSVPKNGVTPKPPTFDPADTEPFTYKHVDAVWSQLWWLLRYSTVALRDRGIYAALLAESPRQISQEHFWLGWGKLDLQIRVAYPR